MCASSNIVLKNRPQHWEMIWGFSTQVKREGERLAQSSSQLLTQIFGLWRENQTFCVGQLALGNEVLIKV